LKENQPLNFSDVLYLLEVGKKVRRSAWQDIKYIALQKPDEQSKMKQPYLYAVGKDSNPYPYAMSNVDLFMSDWVFAE